MFIVRCPEAGVLAALRLKSGQVAWRQVLPEDESIDALVFDGDKCTCPDNMFCELTV